MTASMTCQLLKCDQGMHCLNFFNTADGWLQEHERMFGYHQAHVESTLRKLSFAQPAGEDTANTCCRDSDFCSNCHA